MKWRMPRDIKVGKADIAVTPWVITAALYAYGHDHGICLMWEVLMVLVVQMVETAVYLPMHRARAYVSCDVATKGAALFVRDDRECFSFCSRCTGQCKKHFW